MKHIKRAIVLGGGGSKGSYQIGAWKALRSLNIDYDIVTGTSIGAFNGALMVQGDYEKALELWQDIDIDKVMINGINLRTDLNYYIEHKDKLLPFIKSYRDNKGMDITPLKTLLNAYVDEQKFFNSSVDYGLVSVKIPSFQPCQKRKSSMTKENLKLWILASASCFPAFPICEIGDEGYIDGGYYDNLPIDFAWQLGAQDVIAIALNPKPHKYSKHPLVQCIQPKEHLGGMLDFDKSTMSANITLGYLDTLKSFGKLMGRDFSFHICEMSAYIRAFRLSLTSLLQSELLAYEDTLTSSLQKALEFLTPEGFWASTPLSDKVMNLLDSHHIEECLLTLVESQMQHFDALQIYHLPEVLAQIQRHYTSPLEIKALSQYTQNDKLLLEAFFRIFLQHIDI
ncbi:patatin-like phospholipase family protein [Helicobacter sp. MIT 05-5293]|uniref:patatin-like phospholipase family protein n=1 Tax=Helicobacter sp. MIT 05-5293 TaxID=1548149 RepID=UPI001F5447E6|nr:patatin-like phospholipase family protein [Helicobacter sp. MIT 05-5293]